MFRVLAQEGYTHQYISGVQLTRTGACHLARTPPGGLAARTPGMPAPTITAWNASACSTTSTSSPSDSIDARHGPADCSSTGCCSKSVRVTDPHPLADLIGGITVKLPDEEDSDEQTTLEPLSSNTFGKF